MFKNLHGDVKVEPCLEINFEKKLENRLILSVPFISLAIQVKTLWHTTSAIAQA